MSKKRPQSEVSRRKFLAGAAVTGAATSASVAKAGTPPIGAAKSRLCCGRPAADCARSHVDVEVKPEHGRRDPIHGRRDQVARHRLLLR